VFDKKGIEVVEVVEARKEKIEADAAWEILQDASEVLVAKGKKSITFSGEDLARDAVLAVVLGRSGTLRAPTLKIGERFIVGFNEDIYSSAF